MRSMLLVSTAAAVLAIAPGAALAQTQAAANSDTQLEEIIVTSTKRAERL